ncbi:MAG: hypothetical protein E6X18_00415 [Atopobium minutum]|uniref:siphovirus ReqiPepy6 Gp37-like protein n=1 Tax=Atopobium TaxID=1380 RepID=UPI0003AE2799|nr:MULTISPECIES: siphovirus ReqiPepy6 Gp37-like protein [Atopobium]ERL15923.1 siphovirus ReqiPepy6 Gp37-like protein [Atopobium sp. BV3Ac4]MDU4969480.1 hypothetical protein [Atopobium minutum]MDU5356806.1 hypothetical protein [Atopobium minutum]MDU5892288.1 hypothetical protein [Atopobium minutum]
MELIVTNKKLEDIGILDVKGDFAYGMDENDFSLRWQYEETPPEIGGVIYCEGTDVGGIIRGYDIKNKELKLIGDSWCGVLAKQVVSPPQGQDYRTVRGELNKIAKDLCDECGLGGFVEVISVNSGITIDHTFKGVNKDETQRDTGRYMSLWAAFWQLCVTYNTKVRATWTGNPVKLRLEFMKAVDYSQSDELPTNTVRVDIKTQKPTNHLVCLGKGELHNRQRLDLYMDDKGNISRTQSIFGLDAMAELYDYSSSETLEADGKKKLKELWEKSKTVSIDIPDDFDLVFDLGDRVGGVDLSTGIAAHAIITKKIVKVPDGTITYETTVK